jgi:hypothetical protein
MGLTGFDGQSTSSGDQRLSFNRIRPFGLQKFVLSAELALIFFFSLRPASDPDYGWHLANGRHVLDGVTLSGRDPYSWTANAVWVAHEWLTEVVMSMVDNLSGPSGNSILAALVIVAAYGIVFLTLRRRGIDSSVANATIPICFIGALRSVAVRPHVVEILFVALLVLIIESYLRRQISTRQFLIVVVCFSLLWVNMHGSFPLITALTLITAVELGLVSDRRWKLMAGASAASVLSFVVNPWGWRIYAFALQSITSHPTQIYIEEWRRPALTEWLALPILIQLSLGAVGLAWSLRLLRRNTGKPDDSAIPNSVGALRGLAFGFLALQSGRHIMLFGIANAWLIATGLQVVLRKFKREDRTRDSSKSSVPGPGKEIINLAALVAIVVTVAAAGWKVVSPEAQRRSLAALYPVSLLEHLNRSYSPADRLFNEYRWGGFLINRTSVPVFIDGRSELYGDRQLVRYASIVHMERNWKRELDSMRITLVLMPTASPLSRELSRRGWRTIAGDSVGSLLARK